MKLLFPDSVLGRATFADLYRFGGESRRAPLLVYVGGAVDPAVYLERRSTEAQPILAELDHALGERGGAAPRLDFALLSHPPRLRELHAGHAIEAFRHHLLRELLPRLGAPPAALAAVGRGLGARLLAGLALSDPGGEHTASLVTLGGTDLLGTIESLGPDGAAGRRLRVLALANDGDPARAEAERFVARLGGEGVDATLDLRHGAPAWSDYAANGAVATAFLFSLAGLAARPL